METQNDLGWLAQSLSECERKFHRRRKKCGGYADDDGPYWASFPYRWPAKYSSLAGQVQVACWMLLMSSTILHGCKRFYVDTVSEQCIGSFCIIWWRFVPTCRKCSGTHYTRINTAPEHKPLQLYCIDRMDTGVIWWWKMWSPPQINMIRDWYIFRIGKKCAVHHAQGPWLLGGWRYTSRHRRIIMACDRISGWPPPLAADFILKDEYKYKERSARCIF